MTTEEVAASVRAGASISALGRMPLAVRARIESESDALLALLARERQIASQNVEVDAAIQATEELLARIQSDPIAARM